MADFKVLILMATFNGHRFIGEQIESIKAQTHEDWELWVSDDGSSDTTLSIVKSYSLSDPRIKLLDPKTSFRSACGNFSYLLSRARDSDCDVFLFSDQDDVWDSKKLEVYLSHYSNVEYSQPTLIHSDLNVVDERLSTINTSFFKMQKINHESDDPLGVLLVQNFVTGCTMLLNRPLLNFCLPVSKKAIMHDWWIAIIAATVGNIEFIHGDFIKYRQHENNTLGAKGFWKNIFFPQGGVLSKWNSSEKNIRRTIDQTHDICEHLESMSISTDRLRSYAGLLSEQPMTRWLLLRRLGIRRQSKALSFLFYLRLSLLPKES